MRLDPPALLAASTIVATIGLILLAVSATGIEAILGPSLAAVVATAFVLIGR